MTLRFRALLATAALSLCLPLGLVASAETEPAPVQTKDVDTPQVVEAPKTAPDPAIERGRYIAVAADCVACHSNPKSGKPFSGGYALETPFGTLLSSNITSDPETGIGRWTEAEFTRALREGLGKEGQHLYPAMPYTSYTKMSDQDVHDLWLYMKTVPPVRNAVVTNQLPFPFNIRALLMGWNLLFFEQKRFEPRADKSAAWNRGAYLSDALAHCGACHTPKNVLGADKASQAYHGEVLQSWYAPDITTSKTGGIGDWSKDDIVQYLKIGSNRMAVASGPMAEAVTNSTQHLTDADLAAIADYLQTLPPGPATEAPRTAATGAVMAQGKRVFDAQCKACHASDGTGIRHITPSFPGNTAIQSHEVAGIVRTVLAGARGAITAENPTGAAMPSFAWNLSDQQIAAALTYIRNSWGNRAPPVTAEAVASTRKTLNLNAVGRAPHPAP